MKAPTEFFQESEHPFAELYRKRVEQNRDLVILITDSSNDRGTGKTTEALRLASGMDRTDEGLTTEKVALEPEPMIDAYTSKPRGSGIVLDETEVGMDKYRANSAVSKAIRELVSMGRIEEKYLILNAPADHLVDNDLKSLVDVWILVERRGFAHVYRMDWDPHNGHPLTHRLGTLEWDAIPKSHDLHDVYDVLTKEKQRRLRGDKGEDFIKQSEAEKMVEQTRKEVKQEIRDTHIQRMARLPVLTQDDIASVAGVSQGRVSQILDS